MTPGDIKFQDVFTISFMAGSFAFLKQFRMYSCHLLSQRSISLSDHTKKTVL